MNKHKNQPSEENSSIEAGKDISNLRAKTDRQNEETSPENQYYYDDAHGYEIFVDDEEDEI